MPLSYGEWLEALQRRDSSEDFTRYLRQGGLPDSWLFPEDPERSLGDLTAMRVDSFLLREIVEGGSFRHPAALRPLLTLLANHMGEILSARVITSYSIHYTKLYESSRVTREYFMPSWPMAMPSHT